MDKKKSNNKKTPKKVITKKITKKEKTNKHLKKIIIGLIILSLFLVLISIIFITKNKIKKINNYDDLELLETNGELVSDDTTDLEDSGITGEDYVIDEKYSIYYTLLTEEEQKLYRQIYANMKNFKESFIPIIEISVDDVLKIYQAVTYDNPDLFWISNGYTYKYKDNNICKQITLKYNGLQYEYDENKKLFDDAVNSIIEEAKKLNSDYEKEKYVFETIIKKAEYDLESYYNQTAYSALVNGKTVCAGYSKAFQYIMNKLGITTYYIVGTANDENHAWNIIKLDDGYYNVDLTWEGMNIDDLEFSSTHVRSEFSSLLPKCDGKEFVKTVKKNKIITTSDKKTSKTTSQSTSEKTSSSSKAETSSTSVKNSETKTTSQTQISNENNQINNIDNNIDSTTNTVNNITSQESIVSNQINDMSNQTNEASNSEETNNTETNTNEQTTIDIEPTNNLVVEENNNSNSEETNTEIEDDEYGKVIDVTEQETDTSSNSHSRTRFGKR